MPYCEACQHEREPGTKKCPVCEGKLVEEIPVPDFTDAELAVVGSYPRSLDAQGARRKLAACGIESVVLGDGDKRYDVGGRGNRLVVRKEEAGWASRVLVIR